MTPPSQSYDCDICVVTYNSVGTIVRCLESMARCRHSVRVLIYDNHSSDDTLASVSEVQSRIDLPVIVTAAQTNDGFPVGVNALLRLATAPVLAVVNPDVELDPASFDALIDSVCADESIGIASCRLMTPDGLVQSEGARPRPRLMRQLIRSLPRPRWTHRQPSRARPATPLFEDRDVECTSGALMVFRRALLDRVGFLDESVFMYLEDLDYCERVRIAGYRIRYFGSLFAVHESGVSTRGRESALYELMPQVWLTFLTRYGSWFERLLARPVLLLVCLIAACRRVVAGELPRGELRAIWHVASYQPRRRPQWGVAATAPQSRVALVTNIVAPYRLRTLEEMARLTSLRVYFSADTEPNRDWAVQRDLRFQHEILDSARLRLRGRSFYLSPRLLYRLWRFRPNAVIVGGFSIPAIYCAAYCTLARRRLILMTEGTRASERRIGSAQRLIRALLVQRASGFVATSTQARDRLLELGADPERCVVAPYAIDAQVWPRRRFGEGPPRLLFVGQLIPRKGLLPLLDALAEVHTDHEFVLTIVGSGPQRAEIEQRISELGLADSVHWAGFVDQPDLPELYAEHDLFVFPTLEDTFGVVLIEAMAAGLPPVASRLAGATPDHVEEGVNGWTMDPRSKQSMVAALRTALDERPRWPEMGGRARTTVRTSSPAASATRIIDIANRSPELAMPNGNADARRADHSLST